MCFGWTARVWWCHIAFMTLSEGWIRRRWMSSHEMGCLSKELLITGVMGRMIMSWSEKYCWSILCTRSPIIVDIFPWLFFQLWVYLLYLWHFVTIQEPQVLHFWTDCNVWLVFDLLYFVGFVVYNMTTRVL